MENLSIIKCSKCSFEKEKIMPTDSCQFFYQCPHGSIKCPPKQKNIPTAKL